MRIALIDNGSKLREQLEALLAEHEVTELSYPEADSVLEGDFDAVILSGSSLWGIVPVVSNVERLRAEMRLISDAKIPLLGICYGNELVAFTLGGTLREMQEKVHGMRKVEIIGEDAILEGIPLSFDAYESHHWAIETLPSEFKVLARSENGPEIIRHTERPLYGFQFHPEKMTSEPALQLFRNFLALAKQK